VLHVLHGMTTNTDKRARAAHLLASGMSVSKAARKVGCDRTTLLRGDEALSVFGSARQAIRAAVELQTRFRAADSAFPLGIGIGLDAGEAVRSAHHVQIAGRMGSQRPAVTPCTGTLLTDSSHLRPERHGFHISIELALRLRRQPACQLGARAHPELAVDS
jgi:hypothetical protein